MRARTRGPRTLARRMLSSETMQRTTRNLAATVLLGAGLLACGSALDSAFGDESSSPSASDSDAGFGGATAAPGASGLGPTDNAVILVHAAGLGAFRVCFAGAPNLFPQPDRQTMPDANVVGVEVGTAVRLPPVDTSVKQEVYVYEERPLRLFTAAGGTEVYDCQTLLTSSTPGIPKPVAKMTVTTSLAVGVHLLVLSGCGANSLDVSRTTAQCGADFKPDIGNLKLEEIELQGAIRPSAGTLPTQVVHLSQQLELSRADAGANAPLEVRYGPEGADAGPAARTSVATNPTFLKAPNAQPAPVAYDPTDTPVYAEKGFEVTLGGKRLFWQSLADIAKLSSPQALPSSYYAVASNYVLLRGDPAARGTGDAGPDDLERLHFLVVPVIEPKADGGTAESDDGGT